MAEELDRWFPRPPRPEAARRLGIVVGGSLSKGLEVKLDPQTVIEGLAVGRYVSSTAAPAAVSSPSSTMSPWMPPTRS
jgi:hypothetical protein